MGSQKLLPISDFCLDVNYKFFLYLLDETGSDIDWGNYNKDLNNTNQVSTYRRCLLDILHTAIDGYTVDSNGRRLIEWRVDDRVDSLIFKNLEDFEYIRLSLAIKFIDSGYASPTDYLHVIKLHLINNKKIKVPDQFINLSKTQAYKYKTKNINSTVDDILRLFLMTYGSLSLKSVLPLKALSNQKDKKNKFAKPILVPEYINFVTKNIINNNLSKNQIRSLHEKGLFDNSKINKSRFNRDWTLFRFKSLKLFIFDIVNTEQDKRVSVEKQKIGFQNYKDSDFKNNFIYNYKISFTEQQINSIKNNWKITSIKNPLVVRNFNVYKIF